MSTTDTSKSRPRLSVNAPLENAHEIEDVRKKNDLRLKKRFENIFDKYERDFTEVGDVVDLRTGRLEVDNGHFRRMRNEQDAGSRIRASRRVTVEDEVERHDNRRDIQPYSAPTNNMQPFVPPSLPQAMVPPPPPQPNPHMFQPQQSYATYQSNTVSLPVMNQIQQFNPFDPNALVTLIDQRIQARLAQERPRSQPRVRSIENRWSTPSMGSELMRVRSPTRRNAAHQRRRRERLSTVSLASDSRSDSALSRESEHEAITDEEVWDGDSVITRDDQEQLDRAVRESPELADDDDVSQPGVQEESLWADGRTQSALLPASKDNLSLRSKRWSATEISLLKELKSRGARWQEICDQIPGRDKTSCINLWKRLQRSEHKKSSDLPTSTTHAAINVAIQETTGGTEKPLNRVSEGPKYSWGDEEDQLIVNLHGVKGISFKTIQQTALSSHTVQALKTRYFELLREGQASRPDLATQRSLADEASPTKRSQGAVSGDASRTDAAEPASLSTSVNKQQGSEHNPAAKQAEVYPVVQRPSTPAMLRDPKDTSEVQSLKRKRGRPPKNTATIPPPREHVVQSKVLAEPYVNSEPATSKEDRRAVAERSGDEESHRSGSPKKAAIGQQNPPAIRSSDPKARKSRGPKPKPAARGVVPNSDSSADGGVQQTSPKSSLGEKNGIAAPNSVPRPKRFAPVQKSRLSLPTQLGSREDILSEDELGL